MLPLMLLHVIDDAPVTPANIWHHWGDDPGSLFSIVVIAVLYGIGVYRLWKRAGRDHVVSRAEVAAFYCGIVTLLIALCSPLDAVAETLFSAHMLQHVLLIAVAAPLAVLGAPLVPLLWSLPRSARVGVGRAWNAIGMRRAGHALTHPVAAWGLHTVALWGWHLPGPYSAALASAPIHAFEHICFYGTALLVWWVAFRPLRDADGFGGSMFVLLGTLAQGGALGALLTFSGTPWYAGQSVGAAAWQLTALEDQQLAGLVMWVPAGIIYLIGVLAVMRRIFDAPPVSASARVRAATVTIVALIVSASIQGCSRSDNTSDNNRPVINGDPANGRTMIVHYGCGACHAIPGIPTAVGKVGPSLSGIANRRMIAGIAQNTPDQMVRWIMVPQTMAPGNAMPDLGVSETEARDIAAYLYTLH